MQTGTALGAGVMSGAFAPEMNFFGSASAFAAESAASETPKFVKAVPVWEEGREEEMNVTLVFFAALDFSSDAAAKGAILRSTGATIMRVMLNNQYVGYGPARGPHGWFRIDEWDLSKAAKKGTNFLTVEVAGYNSNSFYHLDQPSFLQAEVIDGEGKVLAATSAEPIQGVKSFQALDYTGIRVQKVQRFSFQRPFIEVWDLTKVDEFETVKLAKQPDVKYLPRRVPYPEFAVIKPTGWGMTGKLTKIEEKPQNPWRDRSLTDIGPKLKGYKMDELSILLSDEVHSYRTTFDPNAKKLDIGSTYNNGDVQIVDFGADYCGFFGMEVATADEDAEIIITFDEILDANQDLNFVRLGTCSAMKWTIKKGTSNVYEAFEPQVGRFAKIHCVKGSFTLKDFYIREYAYPPTRKASFDCSDKRIVKVYNAANLTFRENSVDAFTDCPHRERAGWLCDSFFTSRVAFDLTGTTDVEKVFFENYQLPESFKCLPDGMLPMCYPADHYDGVFIPSWAMWFIAQLQEYSRRTPDQSTVEALRDKIVKLLDFLAKYENSDGLLEKLPSWVFVEWSAANNFVQDVNYPNNMLYGFILDAAGQLYGVLEWRMKAEKVRAEIRKQSFDGEFFVDHAIRKEDGTLEIQKGDRTEVCQYFAFFFKTATPETYPELWSILLDKFGPNRIKEGLYPDIHKANAFVGNVMRLELLSQAGRGDQLLDESLAYNEYMADRTGTLWELDSDGASCNHGFASHILHIFYRNVLGIASVDVIKRNVVVRFPKIDKLDWASGVMPVGDSSIKLRWEKKDGKLVFSLLFPPGYTADIENETGLELVVADDKRARRA